MTALRSKPLLLLLLACSSSSQPLPGDAAPQVTAGDASAPGVPGDTSPPGSSTDGPGGSPDVPMSHPAPDAAPDTAGAAAEGGIGLGVVTDAGAEVGACIDPAGIYGPFAKCAATTGATCDPVCQARCGCGQRCVVDQSGPHCQTQAGPFVELGGKCSSKEDRCKPGLLCLQESATNDACGAHCYQHCRSDSDCSNGATCVIQAQLGAAAYRLCSPPPDACEPWGTARCRDQAQQPAPLFGCYVMGSNTNAAACECAGTLKIGAPCMFEHECEPGAECVLSGGTGMCRKVCNAQLVVGPDPAPCPAGQICIQFPGSAKYGYCK